MSAIQAFAATESSSIAAMLAAIFVLSCALLFVIGNYYRLKRRSAQAQRSNAELIRHLSEGIYHSSIDGRQLSANPALVKLNGYSTEAEMLRSIEDIAIEWYVEPGRRDEFRSILHSQGSVENFVSEVYRHKTRERIWITESARIVYDDRNGKPLFYEGSVREITETVERLKLEELFRKLISSVPGCLFQFELPDHAPASFTFLSDGFERITGIAVPDILGDSHAMLRRVHAEDLPRYRASFWEAQGALKAWDIEFRMMTPQGVEKWLRITAEPEQLANSTMWHGHLSDISVRKRQDAEIEALAYRDPLTGLANRRRFFRSMESVMARMRESDGRAALLFIDLDNFKRLNDTAGHDAGDSCLRRVAEVLQANAGPGEIAARIGGDEFVLTIAADGHDMAATTALAMQRGNRILDDLRIGFGTLSVSASIGVVVFDADTNSADEILQRADRAMYRAKQDGRDTLVLSGSEDPADRSPIQIAAPRLAPSVHELDAFRPRRRRVN